MTSPVSPDDHAHGRHVTIQELAALRGVKPLASVDELADPNTFESDAEVEEFIADVYASRRASIG